MTVTTFYPDTAPESTSVDGAAGESDPATQTWATIQAAAGDTADDSSVEHIVGFLTSATTDRYDVLWRMFLLFDTSALTEGATILSATLGITLSNIINNFSDSLSVVTTTPNTSTAIIAGDYTQTGTTKQATDKTLAGMTADSATETSFALNATGLSNISKTGITKFGLRLARDVANTEPTWASAVWGRVKVLSTDEAEIGDERPVLTVTYTPPVVSSGSSGSGVADAFGVAGIFHI